VDVDILIKDGVVHVSEQTGSGIAYMTAYVKRKLTSWQQYRKQTERLFGATVYITSLAEFTELMTTSLQITQLYYALCKQTEQSHSHSEKV